MNGTDSQQTQRRIAILGSTGSIGVQTIEVIEQHPEKFVAEVLTAGNNATLLIAQAKKLKPNCVVIADESKYQEVADALANEPIKVYAGAAALNYVVAMETVDIVLTALVGFAGLEPTLKAIQAGKPIALANKETLVVAGQLVTEQAQQFGVNIYPVDSEHSAIFQCLAGEFHNPIEKIILTASGGPFRGKKREELGQITKAQALKHPNWTMGAKITIDSATLFNKGLEVIEAKWLFNLQAKQIEVIVHPQSIVHSLVQFQDGSIKSQMGLPDMKLPILYALGYPARLQTDWPRFNFADYPVLNFEQADTDTFRGLAIAFAAMEAGGNAPCVMNSANEIAVEAFLADKLGFLQIAELVEQTMNAVPQQFNLTLPDYLACDAESRAVARELVRKMG